MQTTTFEIELTEEQQQEIAAYLQAIVDSAKQLWEAILGAVQQFVEKVNAIFFEICKHHYKAYLLAHRAPSWLIPFVMFAVGKRGIWRYGMREILQAVT